MTTPPGACLFLALMVATSGAEARAGQEVAPAPGQCAWSQVAGHEQPIRLPPVLRRARHAWQDGMVQHAMARCQRTVRVLRA